jgi:hypothetical protein
MRGFLSEAPVKFPIKPEKSDEKLGAASPAGGGRFSVALSNLAIQGSTMQCPVRFTYFASGIG